MHAPGLSWKYYLLGVAAHWTSKPPPADPAEALEARRAAMRGFSKPSFLMGYPSPMESVVDGEVAGRPVRRYTPQRPLPGTIVFFHGGGFVIGDLDTHDVLARALATGTQRRVVSVDYRLAPEHPFPAAVTDCVAVTRALAAEEGAGSLALFGDSAGGNLAAVAANACASSDPRIPIIAQVLIYPATDFTIERPSFEAYKDVFTLPTSAARWFKAQYTPDPAVRADPSVSPLLAAKDVLRRTAPAYIALARCDVLHDEGVAYAQAIREAGGEAELDVTPGVPHAYISMLGLSEARATVDRICVWLRAKWGAAVPARAVGAEPAADSDK